MTPTTDAPKSPWQDADLVRTNPVFVADRLLAELRPWFNQNFFRGTAEGPTKFSRCLENLSDYGGRVPDAVVDRFRRTNAVPSNFRLNSLAERPGILGLVVDLKTDDAFVLPLRPERLGGGAHWDVPRSLPFPEEDVQDLLVALLHAEVPSSQAVPERLAYRFANPLKQKVRGNSMTVAATLAVLDELGGRTGTLFQTAVALVEPGVDGALEEVLKVPEKLGAALREHDRLSLVVVLEGGTALKQLDRKRVNCIWEVKDVAALAKRLGQAGLLAPLIKAGTAPLGRVELLRVQNRLRLLIEEQHRYAEAADLADRTSACTKQPPTDPSVVTEIGRLSAAACRHHGRFSDAVALGCEMYKQVNSLGAGASDDEEADAAAEYAASLFSGHRFADVPPLLDRWAECAAQDHRRFRPLTRVKVWNTLARALAVLDQGRWDELFGRSLSLLHRLVDTENINRTTHYRVHARLRHGDAAGASVALEEAPGLNERAGAGSPWAAFLHANLARLEHREWADQLLEQRLAMGARPYSAWLYLQATARQSCREHADAKSRLEQAVCLLRHEAGGVEGNVCNLFSAFLEMNIAARTGDAAGWASAVAQARVFLSTASDHRDHYAPTVDGLPVSPDMTAAEALLNRVPYF